MDEYVEVLAKIRRRDGLVCYAKHAAKIPFKECDHGQIVKTISDIGKAKAEELCGQTLEWSGGIFETIDRGARPADTCEYTMLDGTYCANKKSGGSRFCVMHP